jgi:hypothetical protein
MAHQGQRKMGIKGKIQGMIKVFDFPEKLWQIGIVKISSGEPPVSRLFLFTDKSNIPTVPESVRTGGPLEGLDSGRAFLWP